MTAPVLLRRGRHGRHRVRMRPSWQWLRPALVAFLLLATYASVVLGNSGASSAAAPQPYSGQCPGGASACIQVVLPCGTASCPTVVAGPTDDLASGQYVYLALSNFPPGDTVRIAYCSSDGSDAIDPDPYCATTTPSGIKLSKRFIEIGEDGTTNASTPVAFDPPGQDNPPLSAVPLVQNGNPSGTFFCDNGPDFCEIVVTDDGTSTGAGPTDSTTNTVVVPLTFSAGASACPTTDPQLFSDSSFTVEQLVPAMVQATCAQKNGVVGLNTATNTAQEIGDLTSGGTPVAFSDDPWDAQLDAPLTGGSTSFAYIPVALSATAVAFLGGAPDESQPGIVFPIAKYNMTPNMVAGALTTTYEAGGSADSLVTAPTGDKPPLTCGQLVGCNKNTIGNFNTFYMLNPEPSGVGQPGAIGSFFSNTASGTNYQLSQWVCSAPNAPFELTVDKTSGGPTQVSVTDTYNPAVTTLTTPPTQSPFWDPNTPASEWPFKTCEPTSQFPTLSPGSLSQYQPADTPALQAKSIRAYGSGGTLAFGAMDWSEASFNGLNVAALQNAAGNFVTPSSTSIVAAMKDATEQDNGTYTFNYDDPSNTGAYPMPMITYAVVPTSPVDPALAEQLTDLLTNLVTYSSGNDLPGGYVSLPPNLVAQAKADIAKDIVAGTPKGTGPSTGSSTGTSKTTSSSTGLGATSPGTTDVDSDLGADEALGFLPAEVVANLETPGASAHSPSSSGSPTPSTRSDGGHVIPVVAAGLDVLAGDARFVLPALGIAALIAIVTGPVLLAIPRRRRRPFLSASSVATDGKGGP